MGGGHRSWVHLKCLVHFCPNPPIFFAALLGAPSPTNENTILIQITVGRERQVHEPLEDLPYMVLGLKVRWSRGGEVILAPHVTNVTL